MAGARGACPECGTPMVPTLRGLRCPRLSACGRGGVEERGRPGGGGASA